MKTLKESKKIIGDYSIDSLIALGKQYGLSTGEKYYEEFLLRRNEERNLFLGCLVIGLTNFTILSHPRFWQKQASHCLKANKDWAVFWSSV